MIVMGGTKYFLSSFFGENNKIHAVHGIDHTLRILLPMKPFRTKLLFYFSIIFKPIRRYNTIRIPDLNIWLADFFSPVRSLPFHAFVIDSSGCYRGNSHSRLIFCFFFVLEKSIEYEHRRKGERKWNGLLAKRDEKFGFNLNLWKRPVVDRFRVIKK